MGSPYSDTSVMEGGGGVRERAVGGERTENKWGGERQKRELMGNT